MASSPEGIFVLDFRQSKKHCFEWNDYKGVEIRAARFSLTIMAFKTLMSII